MIIMTIMTTMTTCVVRLANILVFLQMFTHFVDQTGDNFKDFQNIAHPTHQIRVRIIYYMTIIS